MLEESKLNTLILFWNGIYVIKGKMLFYLLLWGGGGGRGRRGGRGMKTVACIWTFMHLIVL